jgi:putative ABC transport system ATP-binding protein
LLVGDEPTGNLDSGTADQVIALFHNLVDQGKTLLIVTHDRDLTGRVGRVIHLHDGRIQRDQES